MTTLAVAVINLAMSSHPAFAQATTDTWSDGNGVGSSVQTTPDTSAPQGHTNSTITCEYGLQTDEEYKTDIEYYVNNGTLTQGTGPGHWYLKLCSDQNGFITTDAFVWLPDANPAGLAQEALQYVPITMPTISLNPAANQDQIVHLPMWLWLNGSWAPTSAQASAGGMTVTTTATPTPTQVVWNTGDGRTVTCNGPGAAYDSSKPDSAQHTDCSHTYTRASTSEASGRFTVTATMTWQVTWNATGVPAGTATTGNLGAINHSTTTTVRVVEVQALNQAR